MPTDEAPAAPVVAIPPLDDYDYQVQRSIETDSKMSAVLLATTAQQRPVVLKIARVDQRSRAEANRQAIQNTVLWLRRLGQHDGLVRLCPIAVKPHGAGRARSQAPVYCATLRQWAGQPEFLVMEYLDGGSLRDFVGAHGLNIDIALWITHHLAQALTYIHQQECVHRDIKPENILFRNLPAGNNAAGRKLGQIRPVLVDFGVAAPRGERRLVSGSRLWMAPELQEAYEQSPLPVNPAWDVYALGLILCYMITGRRPRRRSYEYASVLAYRDRTLAILEQQLQNRGDNAAAKQWKLPWPARKRQSEVAVVNARLAQLITSMLAREAADRPAAQVVAAKTAAALADLGAPLPWSAKLKMQLERSRSLPQRKRLQLALVAALAVGVLLGSLAGLLLTLPATVDARDDGVQTAAPPVQNGENGAGSTSRPTDTAHSVATQPPGLQNQVTPAGALSPEPTLVPLTPTATQLPPTLIPLATPSTEPPTLVPFTPVPRDTPIVQPLVATQPAAAPPTATQTATATSLIVPARGARVSPPSPTPSLTATETAAPVLEQVQLLAPESGTRSDQGKVEFSWQSGQPLANDHCYELVFWDPHNPTDQRSPVGAGKATRGRVDFTLLFTSSDPLLRALAQSNRDFNWGVRIVACATPRTVLQDVQQVRTYSYKGQ